MTELAQNSEAGVRAARPRPPERATRKRPGGESAPMPLAAVMVLGEHVTRVGAVMGLVLALATHGTASVKAISSLMEMQRAAQEIRAALHEFLWASYEIEVDRPAPLPDAPKPPEPEAPPPEPELAPKLPEPSAKPEPAVKDEPYDTPPPPSQAAAVLTAAPSADEPEDLTKEGFVTGDGTGPGFGRVSAAGTGTAATWNPKAAVGGRPGATGTGAVAPPPAPVGPDLSRPPGLVGGTSWSCSFPAEADTDQIDQAAVSILVTVRADGTPSSVRVLSDPGHGFGRAARACALSRRFTPGTDRSGNPITVTSPPITVRFTR